MAKEKYRSRVHMLLLYPDNESHRKAMDTIKHTYDYAAILHDKDIDEEGNLKKPHWHVVLRFQQATWSSAICKNLEIEHNFIEDVKKFDNAMLYLLHYNDMDKHQYDVCDVFGNLSCKLVEIINKGEKSEGEKVVELIEFIENCGSKLSIKEFSKFCATNGYWAEFRRSGAIFCRMIDEHNEEIKKYETND